MKILIDNVEINYKIYGENNTNCIVILHGWGSNLDNFEIVSNFLKNKYKVYAIDLPGFGGSSIPTEALSVIDYANIIHKFLDISNIVNPILIGHSFGGRIIITLIGYLKYNAQKIVLVNSAGIKPKRSIWYYIKTYTYKFLKQFKKIMPNNLGVIYITKLRSIFGSADYNKVNDVMKKTLIMAVNTDLNEYMKKINIPTLLIWGDNDDVTPISNAITMQKLIPDSGLVILKGAGHYTHLDKYDEFKIILLYFLSDGIGYSKKY